MSYQVAIIAGSTSDQLYVNYVKETLTEYEISWNARILSAHRDLVALQAYLKVCDDEETKIYIGVAGMSAALPGVIASLTDKPVIGVPVPGQLLGIDSLLSISQMPKGVPVATMAIGKAGAINAAIFASKILSLVN